MPVCLSLFFCFLLGVVFCGGFFSPPDVLIFCSCFRLLLLLFFFVCQFQRPMINLSRSSHSVKVLHTLFRILFSQMLLMAVAYIIYRSWSHLLYVWKALRRHGLPDRLRDFTKDVYFVYADTDRDVMWACLTLPALLRQHRPLRILLRNQEEIAGADRAESIAQHIETSWKVGQTSLLTEFQPDFTVNRLSVRLHC